jgi:hypothetical protein
MSTEIPYLRANQAIVVGERVPSGSESRAQSSSTQQQPEKRRRTSNNNNSNILYSDIDAVKTTDGKHNLFALVAETTSAPRKTRGDGVFRFVANHISSHNYIVLMIVFIHHIN